MATTLLTALILGLFAGMAPGPYTTMLVATGLEKGFRAATRLALTPLVTDIGPLVITALVLETVSSGWLTAIGVVGGIVVSYIGLRFILHHRHPEEEGFDPEQIRNRPQSATFWHVALSAILSPAPWLFWLVVASPLMIRSWGRSQLEGIVFVVVLFATNIGSATTLAWIASHGGRIMGYRWRKNALLVTGTALSLAGAFLVWQALEGNFQSLIDRQEQIRDFVEEQTGGA